MSNIAILFVGVDIPKGKLVPYYSQLAQSLNQNHSVLAMNMFCDGFQSDFTHQDTEKEIVDFKPDLIIAFNNMITESIYKNTSCPVLIIEADEYNAFHNKNLLLKYINRNYIGVARKNRFSIWKNILPDFDKQNRIIEFKNSTLLKPQHLDQDINISIISTLVGLTQNNKVIKFLIKNWNNEKKAQELKKIVKKAQYNFNSVTKQDYEYLNSKYRDLFHYISYLNRSCVLDNLAELDLKVWGKFYNVEHIIFGAPMLASCLQGEEIITKEQNANLYNRSKISLNVRFAHNALDESASAYSWRVLDIMATNACLVSTYCPAIKEDFSKWVNIPMFHDRHEAYDLCKKLLKEENLRKDIVAGSQLAVKEGKFSFDDRVKELEDLFSLKNTKNEDKTMVINSALPLIKRKKQNMMKKIEKKFIRPILKKLKR